MMRSVKSASSSIPRRVKSNTPSGSSPSLSGNPQRPPLSKAVYSPPIPVTSSPPSPSQISASPLQFEEETNTPPASTSNSSKRSSSKLQEDQTLTFARSTPSPKRNSSEQQKVKVSIAAGPRKERKQEKAPQLQIDGRAISEGQTEPQISEGHEGQGEGQIQAKREAEKAEKREKADLAEKIIGGFLRELYIMNAFEKHPNLVYFHGIARAPLTIVLEFVSGGDLQSILDIHSRVALLEDYSSEAASFEAGTEFLLVCENEIDGEEYVILEKDRRYRVPKSVKLKVVGEPVSEAILPPKLRYKIALDVARGMAFLHSKSVSIIHRDLRSPNICIVSLDPSASLTAKILDFGLAIETAVPSRDPLCTWQWCAPEVLIDFSREIDRPLYDHRCDIYSFGIVLNELASRRCPFIDDYWDQYCTQDGLQWRSPVACRAAIINDNLRPIIPESTRESYVMLTKQCWEADPSLRPPFSKIVNRLEHLLGEIEEQMKEKEKEKEIEVTNEILPNFRQRRNLGSFMESRDSPSRGKRREKRKEKKRKERGKEKGKEREREREEEDEEEEVGEDEEDDREEEEKGRRKSEKKKGEKKEKKEKKERQVMDPSSFALFCSQGEERGKREREVIIW
eukprot:CAMPEP_0201501700 /NCGR_PEP_ID=MMETSP0151_2-20130828/83730_1 /ASSEMBLY_ACC=CAM_ASM_000257 /TAXON_ID=200890 /ORGANISM="Paramoeba atlantica, Strain 621/1 / CCAP 1560/9" /LENGTH=623 /DNA_ID=CAMNT_0047895227 /DNA_START=1441 /DNA_END=3309 /DNA_ORIENTATION=-